MGFGVRAWPTVGKLVQRLQQALQDAFDILANVSIVKYQRWIAQLGMAPVASRILCRIVRFTVNFNNKAFCWAEEIYDTIADDVLTTKLMAGQLRATEAAPQSSFKRC